MTRLSAACLICVVVGCVPSKKDLVERRSALVIKLDRCIADVESWEAARDDYASDGITHKAIASDERIKQKLAEANHLRKLIEDLDSDLFRQ